MSENHRDLQKVTQETTDGQEASEAMSGLEDAQNTSETQPTHTSLEDTGESSVLQEQETSVAQNNGAQKPSKTALPKASKPALGSKEAALEQLRYYTQEMNDYMTWKENLRITSIDLQIGGPYFDLWTQEANLFFRRLVILRKRIESIKKQQRA